MLKYAYQIGLKIAELEEAAALENDENAERAENAAAELAQVLQSIPVNMQPPDPSPSPGEPDEDDQYGESSINYAFDDLSRIGLDVQGPTDTSV